MNNGSPDCRIIHAPAARSGLLDRSAHCCVTSPPFWAHRRYETEPQVWEGDPPWTGELGQEPSPEMYVEHLVQCFREVKRVLRDDGVCFVNSADTYCSDRRGAGGISRKRGNPKPADLKTGDLTGVPFIFALAMRRDGWFWRSLSPWVKASSLPESVKDRPTAAVEYWMMFTKARAYFYDAEAVKLPLSPESMPRARRKRSNGHKWKLGPGRQTIANDMSRSCNASGRNRRNSDPWYESIETLAAEGRGGMGMVTDPDGTPLGFDFANTGVGPGHYASFPYRMIQPLIRASTSEGGCCVTCSTPRRRVVKRTPAEPVRWAPGCVCPTQAAVPCTVYDPFTGSGTTAIAALGLGRRFVGTELSSNYVNLARQRIGEWREKRAGDLAKAS